MTSAAPVQYGIEVDDLCEVSHIGPVKGSRDIRVWARVRNTPGLMLQFDLPSGTRVGATGWLRGRRYGTPKGILEEVAKNCGVDASKYQNDMMYADVSWTPGDAPPAPKPTPKASPKGTYSPASLPVEIRVEAGSFWTFRGRKIEILSSTGPGIDAMLQVRVVQAGQGRRGAAKKVSVRTLLSRYTPA